MVPDGTDKTPPSNDLPSSEGPTPVHRPRVERSPYPNDSEGGSNRGRSVARASASDGRREERETSPDDGDPQRRGHPPGVPPLDPSEALLEAFRQGDAQGAVQAAQQLRDAYHEALLEASRLRYRLNFGTSLCDNCEGLRAGPGVLATCFQVKVCNFANIKEGSQDPRHVRVLRTLLRE
jgi:hypothetical protein